MDWGRLSSFRVAARHEHLGRAAGELEISVSALSRTIGRLEASCGAPLFDRVGRGIRLNAAGRVLLSRVERAVREIESGEREVREIAAGIDAKVVLGFLGSFGTHAVPELISSFRARFPAADFRLLQGRQPVLRQMLLDGEIDLCLASPFDDAGIIGWQPLWREKLVALLPPEHRWASRPCIGVGELAGEPIVALYREYPTRQALDALAQRAGFVPRIVFEGEEMATLVGLAGAGIGIAVVPIGRAIASSSAVPMPLSAPRCFRTVGLSWRRDRALSAAAALLRDHVIAQARIVAAAEARRVAAAFAGRARVATHT